MNRFQPSQRKKWVRIKIIRKIGAGSDGVFCCCCHSNPCKCDQSIYMKFSRCSANGISHICMEFLNNNKHCLWSGSFNVFKLSWTLPRCDPHFIKYIRNKRKTGYTQQQKTASKHIITKASTILIIPYLCFAILLIIPISDINHPC